MSEIRTLTCIGCPMGCELIVEIENGEFKSIQGHACNIGIEYSKKEITNPLRMITSILPVTGGDELMVSVKTSQPIPKGSIKDCMFALKGIHILAPIKVGDILIENICGLGVNIIATKEVHKA